MPKGLLDKLTREEIMDLIAYVYSEATPSTPSSKAGGMSIAIMGIDQKAPSAFRMI